MFDGSRAARALKFINLLCHTKGEWAGQPFNLREWQRKPIEQLFGTLNEDGSRQYRTCYWEIPRKNGKSETAAAIALYMLFADGEVGGEIYSCAADREQASLVFNVAAQMIRYSPELSAMSKIVDSQKRIVVPGTGSFYRAISAEAYTKHGFNAHGVIFDELHTQPNRELWDTMSTAGGTRRQPLLFAITTAGYDRNSICWEIHEYADKVKRGIVQDPTFLPVIYAAPVEADWRDEKVWHECNPALGDFRRLEELRMHFRKASEVPAYENTFRRLFLNQWTRQETRYYPMDKWDACDGPVVEGELIGRKCWSGLDLASTTDIAALVHVFPPQDEGGYWQVLPRFWVPQENMVVRSRRDHVDYDLWCQAGLIEATPGNVIDYRAIFHRIDEDAQMFDIQEVAFDRWGATQISQELAERGMTMVPFGQGFKSMSPPTVESLKLVLSGKLAHGGNPVLRWMADNFIAQENAAGWFKPDKGKSTERIDGIVAMIMAIGRATVGETTGSIYDTRGVRAV